MIVTDKISVDYHYDYMDYLQWEHWGTYFGMKSIYQISDKDLEEQKMDKIENSPK